MSSCDWCLRTWAAQCTISHKWHLSLSIVVAIPQQYIA